MGTGNHDFLTLVDLRRSHQTRHAAKGVRTCDSAKINRPNESVRCKSIREMNALLRQDEACAPGSGQDCKSRWQTVPQGTTSSNPERQQTVPARPTGNSANAATITAQRTQKVFHFVVWIWPSPDSRVSRHLSIGRKSLGRRKALITIS